MCLISLGGMVMIIIGADPAGEQLKEELKNYLIEKAYAVKDVSSESDFVDTTLAVVAEVTQNETNLGIVIDAFGVGSFMTATKIKGMIAAEVSDERSAYMTREHNNARLITLGSEIVGVGVAKNIVEGFVTGKYAGGRHQIRVDMLNKMC